MGPVVHEAGELVLVKVEDGAGLVLAAAHRAHGVGNCGRPEASQDGVDVADGDATLGVGHELDRNHAVLACDQTPRVDGGLVVARDEGQSGAEGLLGVASSLLDQSARCFGEQG